MASHCEELASLNEQNIAKVKKGQLGIIYDIFRVLGVGTPMSIETIVQIKKNFWLRLASVYENLCNELNIETYDEYMEKIMMYIFTAFEMPDEAYQCALKFAEFADSVYWFEIEEFATQYKGSMRGFIELLEKKFISIPPSSAKDSVKKVIATLKERENLL